MDKTLIFRLSSLGDVVLSSAALSVAPLANTQVDWVVAQEYAELLEGHPRIRKLVRFDRKSGLKGWLALCRELFQEDYTQVIDLHSSLRTTLARVLFFFWSKTSRKPPIVWKTLRKERWKLNGLFWLKTLWPPFAHPTPLVTRFARTAGGTGTERPELSHLVEIDAWDRLGMPALVGSRAPLCVMPSARWPGKQWPVSKFVSVLERLGAFPIILGTPGDAPSVELVAQLKKAKIPHFAAWEAAVSDRVSFKRTASLLSHAQLYLGCDTGLGHLAEAVGARAVTLFGPTAPEMGFGPWKKNSVSVEPKLWCRPCGKDGRFCFRPFRRYHCQTLLAPDQVLEALGVHTQAVALPGSNSRALDKNFLGRIYAWLLGHVVGPWILPRRFSQHRRDHRLTPDSFRQEVGNTSESRCWFHAASAGELESLWTVILKASQVFDSILVTGFSESIGERLQRLNSSLTQSGRPVKWIGYSPYEGEWHAALAAIKPNLFVTAKYEAWPELWLSLSDLGIPLAIVGAQSRPSLKVAKYACAALGGEVPQLHLLTSRKQESAKLEALFPRALVRSTGDPRWDRVQQRATSGSARARELVGAFQKWPKPWGVLGQVWEEDLKVWAAELANIQGTLWVVPHRVDGTHVASLEKILTRAGLTVLRTSRLTGPELVARQPQTVILGDELGFLSELYAAVDWAYIGGGFTAGVHSTIEPAIHGIPLAAGPKNATRFPEIAELVETGQLKLITGARDVRQWHAFALSVARSQAVGAQVSPVSEDWRRQALERLGSTDRVMQALAEAAQIVPQ